MLLLSFGACNPDKVDFYGHVINGYGGNCPAGTEEHEVDYRYVLYCTYNTQIRRPMILL